MNNNRNNNRRRGRGNRNQGGGNSSNRIDSRARSNAPQLLDKYKKLAQDAQHNDDRVLAEYYLQFADHYFRVIADNKARQDEQRSKRDNDRGNERDRAGDDSSDDQNRRDQDGGDQDGGDDRRKSKPKRASRSEKPRGKSDRNRDDDAQSDDARSDSDDDGDAYEADDNPFVRKRGSGSTRRSSARKGAEGDGQGGDGQGDEGHAAAIDESALPPAIAAATSDGSGEEKSPRAKPKRRTRKSTDEDGRNDGDEALSAVG